MHTLPDWISQGTQNNLDLLLQLNCWNSFKLPAFFITHTNFETALVKIPNGFFDIILQIIKAAQCSLSLFFHCSFLALSLLIVGDRIFFKNLKNLKWCDLLSWKFFLSKNSSLSARKMCQKQIFFFLKKIFIIEKQIFFQN